VISSCSTSNFHGDNGASHQTGWTGTVARLLHLFGSSTADQFLEIGTLAVLVEVEPERPGQSKSQVGRRAR
jgi:hypothetical protein